MFDPRRKDLEHSSGSSADVEQIARVGRGDDPDQRRLDLALVDIEGTDPMPLRGILAEIRAGEIGALLLDCAEPLEIEGDGRIGLPARGNQLPGEGTGRGGLAQTIKYPTALAETVEQAGVA